MIRKYELINTSDKYTMEGEEIACFAAAILLGEGNYGLKHESGENLPLFLFSKASDFETWWRAKFGIEFQAAADANRNGIRAALESVTLVGKERTSLNDIGGRAKQMAQQIKGTIQ